MNQMNGINGMNNIKGLVLNKIVFEAGRSGRYKYYYHYYYSHYYLVSVWYTPPVHLRLCGHDRYGIRAGRGD